MDVSNRPPANSFVTFARKIYKPVGFSKGYNFILWFIFLGAFLGFTLARLQYLDFYGNFCRPGNNGAGPGECFYWLQGHYRVGMILHLGCILPAALLACIQFIPVVRYKAMIVHRVNGHVVILLSLVATAGAFMVARRSYGGGIDIQVGVGLLGIGFLVALVIAYINIKRLQIEQHRAWMLRAWFWAGSIITVRIIMILAALILPMTGTYYVAQPCDKIQWTFNQGGLSNDQMLLSYPACAAFLSGEVMDQHATAKVDFSGAQDAIQVSAAFDFIFGTALWLAFALHVIGVELYLHLTPAEAERLRKVSYQKQLEAGMKHPGRAGLTADRLGDAPIWTPHNDNSSRQDEPARSWSVAPQGITE
ncbi:uncharacterized protein BCR38DRAFT_486337 [Pseudomassariella vexata]|uniref:Microtubule associated protein n=1 Tax=Pseudomassariella vexata TaxID=1141098 RepID=A0A1Y2DS07_9PEZI|nr:uncharacterized protein BCR38DRAFT_486337 [Pseudomassariella vexata]ORY62061.1 hypothetical protein BCR38DRAFT_486337 [Pseudomassariella vexata]